MYSSSPVFLVVIGCSVFLVAGWERKTPPTLQEETYQETDEQILQQEEMNCKETEIQRRHLFQVKHTDIFLISP